MLNKILHNLTINRHRIRYLTFDELSEIYTSMMLRSLAINLAGIFIPLYLYQHGYAIWQILLFYAFFYGTSGLCMVPVAYLIARIGPKRTIFISYFLQIFGLIALINTDSLPLIVISVLLGMSQCTFFLALHIDFSKVKHGRSAGNEVGWLYIAERIGAISGPLAGGLIAYLTAPQYTFVVAVVVLVLAAIPLMLSKEPTKTRQKLKFSKMKLRSIKHDIISYTAFTTEGVVSMIVWPLFVGVIILRENPYVQLGSIISVSIIVSILLTRMIGKLVDNRKGRALLRYNAIFNAGLHTFRPFVTSYAGALAVSMGNEAVTPGYRMPYLKGFYQAADDHPGYRIVYITVMEIIATFSRFVFFILATGVAYFWLHDRTLFSLLFLAGALCSLVIIKERYPALNPRRRILNGRSA